MAFDERIIDQVQSANDIVEIISGYIPLKRAGRSFKALCPFHQEKTPSFIVHPEKQIFHCFGCGAGGDVFSFLMKFEQLNFPEALAQLAERAHIKLPETKSISPRQRSETEELYQIYACASDFYQTCLRHSEIGKPGRTYLAGRGFGEKEIEQFRLGLAVSDWRRLYEFLSKKGFREDSLLRSGLVLRSSRGSPYDLFRNRIMFPIFNAQAKPIAFGGRVMGEETPKYLNSPESPIFRKRQELYGLHLAKQAMASGEIRRAMITEGYLDVIRLHANGFQTAVATLGTSLTNDHVRILKRYVDEAIVVFDGDKAGEAASLRSLDIFLEEAMSVKVLSLPKGFDPDSLIQSKGPQAMAECAEQSQDLFDFKLAVLLRRYNRSDSLGLLKITSEFLETFTKMKSPVLLDRYLKRLAITLGVEEGSLRQELKKLKVKRFPKAAGEPWEELESRPVTSSPFSGRKEPPLETLLLSLLIQHPSYLTRFKESFPDYSFFGEKSRAVFSVLEGLIGNEKKQAFSISTLMNRLNDESLKNFVSELSVILSGSGSEEDHARAFEDCLERLTERRRHERLKVLRGEIAKAEELGNSEQVLKAVKAYQELLSKSGS